MTTVSTINILSKLFKGKLHIQKGGEEILVYCPNCHHHKPKLNINTVTGYYQCWVCAFSGKSFYSLLKKLKASKEFYTLLCKDKKPKIQFVEKEEKILELPREYEPLYKSSRRIFYKHALNYCLKRNITIHEILRYNIGYCEEGMFANRVIIPSYNKDGNLNFYCGREVFDGKLKYRLCDGSKDMIGFESYLDFNHELTIVEGVFDAMSVRYNVTPLFGKTLSRKLKIKLLENKPPRVNVLLDNDAFESSLKICDFLIQNNIETYLILLDGKDPNEIGHINTWKCIRQGVRMDESLLYKFKLKNRLI